MVISFMKNHQSLLLHLLLTEVKQAIAARPCSLYRLRSPTRLENQINIRCNQINWDCWV